MPRDSTCSMTLAEASKGIRQKAISPKELTQACLARIESLDGEINSFISLNAEQAIARAEQLTQERGNSQQRSPLYGIPLAVKDLIDVEGELTTAASAFFLNNRATRDATVVQKLKDAGAIILGKTNLHEFAYGGSGLISHFGPVRNPLNPAYITGGSSSGSAAAVAARFCFGAIGTDTAGSIRLPAACCGIVGLKPTYGAVSTDGVVPLSWSYDHVGPMARTVEDTEILFSAISASPLAPETRKLRVALARNFFFEGVDSEIASAIECAVETMRPQIELIDPLDIPVDEDRTISNAEAFAYHRQFLVEGAPLYQSETLRRIRSGEDISAATFTTKRRELDRLRTASKEIFESVDVIITPTVPISPPQIAELQAHLERLRPCELLMLRNTRPFNVLGIPAISIPVGTTAAGFPIGMQLAAAPGCEHHLFAIGKLVERLS